MRADVRENQISYYGWIIVAAAFVLFFLCFGGLVLIGILIKPLAEDFGWQRGEISAAYTISSLSLGAAGVLSGRLSDRYGARVLCTIGAVAIGICLLLLSQVSALWQLYALFALFGALGPGALYIPLTTAVTHWFAANRGLAVAAAMSGAAVGMGTIPLVASSIMAEVGWRNALFYLGIGYLVIAIPTVLLVRDRSSSDGTATGSAGTSAVEEVQPISPREAILWVSSAVIFCCICMAVPQVHLPALASDLGFSTERAASLLTVVMFAGTVGRLVLGRVADKFGPLNAYLLASFGQTALVFWFTQGSSLAVLYSLAVVFGLFFGGVVMSALLTIRSLVPARMAGTSIGLVIMSSWIGMGLGGYLGGALFDWSGNYVLSFSVAATAGVINLAILTLLFMRLRRVARGGYNVAMHRPESSVAPLPTIEQSDVSAVMAIEPRK